MTTKKTKNDNIDIVAQATESVKALCERCEKLAEDNARLRAGGVSEEVSAEKNNSAFDCLAVTQVMVFPFKGGPSLGHMRALAQIVLNDQMVIRGLRVMESDNGLFVSYPLDPFYKGEEFKSICNPITRQLREHIENCVLEKYQAEIG